jgi:hypothetical protein
LVTEQPTWFWTTNFPRRRNQPVDGSPPISALKMTYNRVALDIKVTVSLLRGEHHEWEDIVAIMNVPPGEHVSVAALARFGVTPVELSQADVAPADLITPSVVTVTPDLVVSAVDELTAPYRGHRITVSNLSAESVAAFHVKAHSDGRPSMTTARAGADGLPAIAPGGSYSFDVRLKSGEGLDSPVPFHLIDIDAVLWADDSLVGFDRDNNLREIPARAGQRVQVKRVLEVLQSAENDKDQNPYELFARIRSELEALPDADAERLALTQLNMRETKAFVLAELRQFERLRSHDPREDRRWLAEMIQRYERWLRRLPGM